MAVVFSIPLWRTIGEVDYRGQGWNCYVEVAFWCQFAETRGYSWSQWRDSLCPVQSHFWGHHLELVVPPTISCWIKSEQSQWQVWQPVPVRRWSHPTYAGRLYRCYQLHRLSERGREKAQPWSQKVSEKRRAGILWPITGFGLLITQKFSRFDGLDAKLTILGPNLCLDEEFHSSCLLALPDIEANA